MNIGREAINNVLRLQSDEETLIHCIVNKELLGDIRQSVRSYLKNSIIADDEKTVNRDSFDGLLIGLDAINNENILDVEKNLISVSRRNKNIVLWLKEINLSMNKRDLVLSFIKRYNINILIGTKKEVEYLIGGEKCDDESSKKKILNFCRKNNVILIIKDKDIFLTDGYSEFGIKHKIDLPWDIEGVDHILSGVIAGSTSIRNNKEQKIESILITINAFEICTQRSIEKDNKNSLINNILDELVYVDIDKIYDDFNVVYKFTR